MGQDELKVKDNYHYLPKMTDSVVATVRIWKIHWWDKDDRLHILYTKQVDEDAVIKFCQEKGITHYSVFNDVYPYKNVVNDGDKVMFK